MKHMNKAIIAAVITTALLSSAALAASGNPENPDASTKNWQLDELRHSMNSQFSDVNNRIDQIQAGSGLMPLISMIALTRMTTKLVI